MRLTSTLSLLFVLTGCLNVLDNQSEDSDSSVLKHDLEIQHPGFPEGVLQKQQLLVHLDADKHIVSYEMEVDSVFCLETKCEIIPVRLYWDVIGYYDRIELPDGGELTKMDHIPFTREDYDKLDRILADNHSFLKDLKSEQIVNPEKAVRTADGISAPTPISMQSAVVAGAAYTCYTLWHWVNGEVADSIRQITTEQIRTAQLVDLYESGKEAYVEYSINQLIDRSLYDSAIIDAVVRKIPEDDDVVKPALRYLVQASTEQESSIYHDSIEKVFEASGKSCRIRMLESLIASSLEPPKGFFNRISRFLPNLDSYYEVHLLLELEERFNPDSDTVNDQAISLLNNENFLIARRAFWFLEKRSLSPDQATSVEAFRKKYKDRI